MLKLGGYPREYVVTHCTGARDTGWRTARAAHGHRASVLAYLSSEPRNPEWIAGASRVGFGEVFLNLL